MRVKNACVAAALSAVLLVSGAGVADADPAAPNPAPATAPKTTIDTDGTYAVGTDIAPGIYTSAGPVADGTCSWRRTSNPDGATIDNALSHKPQIVEIDPTDKAFRTSGCQTWQLNNDAVPPAPGIAPALAGLQLQAYMAQLNARAAMSGQPEPLAPPAP